MTSSFGNSANGDDVARHWNEGRLDVIEAPSQAKSRVISKSAVGRNIKRRANSQQITRILQKIDAGQDMGQVCQDAGVSIYTLQRWRKRYSGLLPSEAERLRELERENMRLKRLVAELARAKFGLEHELLASDDPNSA